MWYTDYKFWLLMLQGLTILIVIVTKFNDLKHLEQTVNGIDKKVDSLSERVSKIEGKLSK